MYLFKNERKRAMTLVAAVCCPAMIFAQNIIARSIEIKEVGDVSEIPSGAQVISVGTTKTSDFLPNTEAVDAPQYECIYSYTINGKMVQENYSTILQIGEKMTKFSDYSAYALDSVMLAKDAQEEARTQAMKRKKQTMFYFDSEIYQNQPADQMTVIQEVVPNFMSYEEELGAFDWELGEETDTVCGYLCQKATTSYGGKQWTVWFAPEIATTAGPWKFNGLPGLILAATDSEGLHEFRAIVFRKGMTPIAKQKDVTVFASTRDKVVAAKNKAEKAGMAGIDSKMINEIEVMKTPSGKGTIYINGIGLRDRPNGYQALETE